MPRCLRAVGRSRGGACKNGSSGTKIVKAGIRYIPQSSSKGHFDARKRSKSVNYGPRAARDGRVSYSAPQGGSRHFERQVRNSGRDPAPVLPPPTPSGPSTMHRASAAAREVVLRRAFPSELNPCPCGRDPGQNRRSRLQNVQFLMVSHWSSARGRTRLASRPQRRSRAVRQRPEGGCSPEIPTRYIFFIFALNPGV